MILKDFNPYKTARFFTFSIPHFIYDKSKYNRLTVTVGICTNTDYSISSSIQNTFPICLDVTAQRTEQTFI